jgi:hypothetical protein
MIPLFLPWRFGVRGYVFVIGGLIFAAGVAVAVADATRINGSIWDDGWVEVGIGIAAFGAVVMIISFFMGSGDTEEVVIEARREKDGEAQNPLAIWMDDQLTVGYRIHDRARLAVGDEFLAACIEFREWGQMVNEWVTDHAPRYRADLTQNLALAISGKAAVREGMKARLRTHGEVAKRLRAGETSPISADAYDQSRKRMVLAELIREGEELRDRYTDAFGLMPNVDPDEMKLMILAWAERVRTFVDTDVREWHNLFHAKPLWSLTDRFIRDYFADRLGELQTIQGKDRL